MRFIFSFIGILAAAVIVLLLARNQLDATRGLVDKTKATVSAPTGGSARVPGAADASGAAVTVQEASQQMQRNVRDDVNKALQQGAAARAGAQDK